MTGSVMAIEVLLVSSCTENRPQIQCESVEKGRALIYLEAPTSPAKDAIPHLFLDLPVVQDTLYDDQA